jgi:hypothetical protein
MPAGQLQDSSSPVLGIVGSIIGRGGLVGGVMGCLCISGTIASFWHKKHSSLSPVGSSNRCGPLQYPPLHAFLHDEAVLNRFPTSVRKSSHSGVVQLQQGMFGVDAEYENSLCLQTSGVKHCDVHSCSVWYICCFIAGVSVSHVSLSSLHVFGACSGGLGGVIVNSSCASLVAGP